MSGERQAGKVRQMSSGVFFDDHGRLMLKRLAEVIEQAGHVRKGVDRKLYRYRDGVYRSDGEDYAKDQVRRLLDEDCQAKHFGNVVAWLDSHLAEQPAQSADIVNVSNGLLHLDTLKIEPHDPDLFSTIQLPVAWEPSASCPRVERFLADVLPDDAVDFMLEIIGYALVATNIYQRAVMLYGQAGTGKSRLLALIKALIGTDNISAQSLQDLTDNRFRSAELFGKLANICADLDARAISRTGVFKMLTGEDTVSAERKHAQPFDFTSFALPIFSANELPLSDDQSLAWFDRWLVVPMEHRFRGTDAEDRKILEKITTTLELEGLLVRAVEAYRRLSDRGGFDLPASVVAATARYRDVLDSVRGFVEECCTIQADVWCIRSTLYRRYRSWCQDTDRRTVAVEVFNDYLRKNYSAADRRYEGTFRWYGIGLLA